MRQYYHPPVGLGWPSFPPPPVPDTVPHGVSSPPAPGLVVTVPSFHHAGAALAGTLPPAATPTLMIFFLPRVSLAVVLVVLIANTPG